eukprot:359841-Chlamydomonas_euryale.AAC.3
MRLVGPHAKRTIHGAPTRYAVAIRSLGQQQARPHTAMALSSSARRILFAVPAGRLAALGTANRYRPRVVMCTCLADHPRRGIDGVDYGWVA